MNARQIELVQSTWREVQPVAEDAAALFYTRLFDLDPSLQRLFRGDLKEQGRKLMAMIGFAVNALPRMDSLRPGLRALGERHARHGMRDEDYDTVAAALIWTLEKGLGAAFTNEVKAAWVAAYTELASVMKEQAKVEA